jgi:hypothetical protein
MCMFVCIYLHTHTHTRARARAYTHTHTHTHTHVQVHSNEYLMTLQAIPTFETRNLTCQPGHILDNSDTVQFFLKLQSSIVSLPSKHTRDTDVYSHAYVYKPVVVAGLEALGAVKILASANFVPLDPGSKRSAKGSTFPLPVPGGSIEMLAGAWPPSAGPLSVIVFDFRKAGGKRRGQSLVPLRFEEDRQRDTPQGGARRQGGDGGEVVSLMFNFGPDGLKLGQPVSLTLPFELQSAAPFRNRTHLQKCSIH